MSEFDPGDLETTGYFLPEDSQLRLKQLREYMGFLANLARPRRPDEDQEWAAEIRVGEVAICLELLEEQIGLVLDELSRLAERGERATAGEAETEAEAVDTEAAEPDVAEPAMDEAGKRYVSGVTLNQIDEINLLLDSLRALGNVVTCSDHAEFTDFTLSVMGDAIFRDAGKLRDIIDDVNAQRLGPARGPQAGVEEAQAVYRIEQRHRPMDVARLGAWPLSAEGTRAQSLAA